MHYLMQISFISAQLIVSRALEKFHILLTTFYELAQIFKNSIII